MSKPAKKETPEDQISTTGGGSNSQKLIEGYLTELVKSHTELEQASGPLKQHIADILNQAKDNGVNTKALQNAVKFKLADDAKRAKIAQDLKDTDTYLCLVQLSLF